MRAYPKFDVGTTRRCPHSTRSVQIVRLRSRPSVEHHQLTVFLSQGGGDNYDDEVNLTFDL